MKKILTIISFCCLVSNLMFGQGVSFIKKTAFEHAFEQKNTSGQKDAALLPCEIDPATECLTIANLQAAGYKDTVIPYGDSLNPCYDAVDVYNPLFRICLSEDMISIMTSSHDSFTSHDTLRNEEYAYCSMLSGTTYIHHIQYLTGRCPNITNTFTIGISDPPDKPTPPDCYTIDSMQAKGFTDKIFCDNDILFNSVICQPYAMDTVEFEFYSLTYPSYIDTFPPPNGETIYLTNFTPDVYIYKIRSLTGNCPDITDTFTLSLHNPSVSYPLLPGDTTLCPGDTLHVILDNDTNGLYLWSDIDTAASEHIDPFNRYFINDTSKRHDSVYSYILSISYECDGGDSIVIPVDYDNGNNNGGSGHHSPASKAEDDCSFTPKYSPTTVQKFIYDTINIYYAVEPDFDLMGGDSVFICRDSGCTLEVVNPNFLPDQYDFKWTYPSGSKDSGSTLYTTDTGWHYVTVSHKQCGLSKSDSTYLEYIPLWWTQINLPPDTILCPGDSLHVVLQKDTNIYYSWHDLSLSGDTVTDPSNRFFINDSFKLHDFVYLYTLMYSYECRLSAAPPTIHNNFDTLHIYYAGKPEFELMNDTVICRDSGYVLEPLNTNFLLDKYDYKWICPTQERDSMSFYTADSGWYFLTVSIEECPELTGKDSVYLEYVPLWWTDINLPADTLLCNKTKLLLDASTEHDSTYYLWLFAAESDTDTGSQPEIYLAESGDTVSTKSTMEFTEKNVGTYTIILIDEKSCKNEQTVTITNDPCNPVFEIPNIITPNGDGINDLLKVKTAEYIFDFAIHIYDRWGVLVYKYIGEYEDFLWDGSYMKNGGRAVPDGPYFYVVTYKDARNKNSSHAGSVTIFR